MAEQPKLTSRELANLIEASTSWEERLVLIEKFCATWDAEHQVRRETNGRPPQPSSPTPD